MGKHTPHSANKKHRTTPCALQKPTPRPDSSGPCSIMRACGGCSWLGVPYHKQLLRKQAALENLFAELLAHTSVVVEPVQGMGTHAGMGKAGSPRAFRYKAATPFAPGPHNTVLKGFFSAGTHRIIPCAACAVEAPGAREILNGVADIAEQLHISAYNEDTHKGLLRHAIVRMGWKTNEAMLTLVSSAPTIPRVSEFVERLQALDERLVTIAHNINTRNTNAMLGSTTRILAGRERMRDQLLTCTFEISPTAFYQVNPQQTEVLYQLASDCMNLQPNDVLLDAYCGSGTIGLVAVSQALRQGIPVHLIGVERNPASIEDAQRNAAINGFDTCSEFIAQDATAWMVHTANQGIHIDVVCLDPPRAGATKACIDAIAHLRPRSVVYVSCNPATQVRDIALLCTHGYHVKRVAPVDLFPHSEHVENICLLTL